MTVYYTEVRYDYDGDEWETYARTPTRPTAEQVATWAREWWAMQRPHGDRDGWDARIDDDGADCIRVTAHVGRGCYVEARVIREGGVTLADS